MINVLPKKTRRRPSGVAVRPRTSRKASSHAQHIFNLNRAGSPSGTDCPNCGKFEINKLDYELYCEECQDSLTVEKYTLVGGELEPKISADRPTYGGKPR